MARKLGILGPIKGPILAKLHENRQFYGRIRLKIYENAIANHYKVLYMIIMELQIEKLAQKLTQDPTM